MNRTHLSTFNQWLDALSGGRSTPPEPAPSDATLRDATSAARQLHDLASRADMAPVNQSLPPTWETFMHAHHIEASPSLTGSRPSSPLSTEGWSSGHAGAFDPLSGRPARLARLAGNIILAAIVLAVVLAGAWGANGTFRSGPPGEPSTIPFAGFLQDDSTPVAGDDGDLLAPATADQCTITPLTIDEVIAIVRDPYGNGETWAVTTGETLVNATPADALVPASPTSLDDLFIATPDIDPTAVRPDEFATDEALAGATATFHMFEACIEANSYFQAWATWQPALLQQSILNVLPPLTSEDDLRALLTDLEANGPGEPGDPGWFPWPLGSGPGMSPLDSPGDIERIARTVDQNIENTWMPEPHYLVTGYTNHYPDYVTDEMPTTSIYDADLDGTPDPLVGYDPRLKQASCFSIIFMWSDERDMWLIQQYPTCG